MKIQLNHTSIFTRNKQATEKLIINRGGTRSSKTFSILQLFLYKALTEQNKKFLILRKYGPSLKITTIMDFKLLIYDMGLMPYVKEEKMDRNFWINGNLIHFDSLDDPYKKKGSNWNYVLFEEFTEFTYDDFMTMRLYLSAPTKKERNQMYGAFNPTDEYHWIKTDLIDANAFEFKEIVSTYKDNPFLDPEVVQTIKDLEKQNPNFHRIYGLAEWGRLEDLIYSNLWDEIDVMPTEFDEVIYGLDFGYTNDSALVRIGLRDGQIYEEELIYEAELTNTKLIEKMNKVISADEKENKLIFCDSAEPDRIDEICNDGFVAIPMSKEKGSVYFSIQHIISQGVVHVTKSSPNLKKEKQSYSWKKTKDGKKLEEPVKYRDHLMDAERGALYTYWKEYEGGGGLGGFV